MAVFLVQLSKRLENHTITQKMVFANSEGSPEQSFSWHKLWFYPTRPFAPLFEIDVPPGHVIPPKRCLGFIQRTGRKNTLTWIGHQTAVIRLDGQVDRH